MRPSWLGTLSGCLMGPGALVVLNEALPKATLRVLGGPGCRWILRTVAPLPKSTSPQRLLHRLHLHPSPFPFIVAELGADTDPSCCHYLRQIAREERSTS